MNSQAAGMSQIAHVSSDFGNNTMTDYSSRVRSAGFQSRYPQRTIIQAQVYNVENYASSDESDPEEDFSMQSSESEDEGDVSDGKVPFVASDNSPEEEDETVEDTKIDQDDELSSGDDTSEDEEILKQLSADTTDTDETLSEPETDPEDRLDSDYEDTAPLDVTQATQ